MFYFIFNYSKKVITIEMPHKLVTHPGICDFELSEDVLGHVVLGHGIHHKVLVPGWALCRPVLVTLLLQEESTEASAQSFFFQRFSVEWEQFLATLSWKYLPDFWNSLFTWRQSCARWDMMLMGYNSHRYHSLALTLSLWYLHFQCFIDCF